MADLKQWVNLDPANATLRTIPGSAAIPPERCGKTITLVAKVKGKVKRGKPVFWGVQLGANNLAPAAATNTAGGWAHQASKGGFSAPGFYEKMVATNAKGEAITTFDLSECGGDEFTVKAYQRGMGGTIKKEIKSDTYTVWRQLYYQVTRMGPSVGRQNLPEIPDIPWGDLRKEYDDTRKPHNIRWSAAPPSKPLITRHRQLGDTPTILATGKDGYARAYEPLVLKVSLVDMLASRNQEDHDFQVVRGQRTYTFHSDLPLFDTNRVDDKRDWFGSVTAPDLGATLDENDFTRTGDATIMCTLRSTPSRRCHKPKVFVTIYVLDNWKNGRSQYNGIWAIHNTVRWGTATSPPALQVRADSAKVGTMIHEFGHAIGMAASVPGPGGNSHPKQYGQGGVTTYGHMGSHCWNGKSGLPASTSDPFPDSPDAICVMFGDSSRVKDVYCDICVDFVRSTRPSVDGKFNMATMLPP